MKRIYSLLIAILFIISLNSCVFDAYTTTQDDIYVEHVEDVVSSNVDVNLVIRYGSPYYYNGSILYYFYNGIYYYPYYYNDYWYFRAYHRPFPHVNYHPYFRPHRYDYRFDRGYHRPNNWYKYIPSTQRYNYNRPGNYNRPNYNNGRIRNYDKPNQSTMRPRGNSFPQRGGSSMSRQPMRNNSSGGYRGRR